MMEDGVDDASLEREASGDLNSMDVEEVFPIDENEDLVGEPEHQVPKKKNGKITAAAMGEGIRRKDLFRVSCLHGRRKWQSKPYGYCFGYEVTRVSECLGISL
ncbi:hypothetical protein YC2023_054799 [Brassica napus]